MQQLADVFSYHALAAETFRPFGESGFVQSFLLARERECEAQGKLVVDQVVLIHELPDTVSDVIEQLGR